MRAVLKTNIPIHFLKGPVAVILAFLLMILIYVLSFGPALKFAGVQTGTTKGGLPGWIQIAYYPVLNSKVAFLNNVFDDYIEFWIGTD